MVVEQGPPEQVLDAPAGGGDAQFLRRFLTPDQTAVIEAMAEA